MPESEKLHPDFIEAWNSISYIVQYDIDDISTLDIITKAPLPDHVEFSPYITELHLDSAVSKTMCITEDTLVSELIARHPRIIRYKSDNPEILVPATLEEVYNTMREIRRRFIEEVLRPGIKQFWENEAKQTAECRPD